MTTTYSPEQTNHETPITLPYLRVGDMTTDGRITAILRTASDPMTITVTLADGQTITQTGDRFTGWATLNVTEYAPCPVCGDSFECAHDATGL